MMLPLFFFLGGGAFLGSRVPEEKGAGFSGDGESGRIYKGDKEG